MNIYLIVAGGPLASLITGLIYWRLYDSFGEYNQILSMLLSVLCATSLYDFIWNILPINMSRKADEDDFSFTIENDGYLLKQLLQEKYQLNRKPRSKNSSHKNRLFKKRKFEKSSPKSGIGNRYKNALRMYENGDYVGALNELEIFLKENGLFPDSYRLMIDICIKLGYFFKANHYHELMKSRYQLSDDIEKIEKIKPFIDFSYKNFIEFFGRDRFDKELVNFINQFGNYKLKSHEFADDISYFEVLGTFTDHYINFNEGFELLFEDMDFNNSLKGGYPEKLVLVEIIFYLEKYADNYNLNPFGNLDVNSLMKKAFQNRIFTGILPGDILLDDNRQIIWKKMGSPLKSDRINNFDTFISEDNNYIFKVVYTDNSETIKFLTICPVEYEKSKSLIIKD